jgi:hypothetical protein
MRLLLFLLLPFCLLGQSELPVDAPVPIEEEAGNVDIPEVSLEDATDYESAEVEMPPVEPYVLPPARPVALREASEQQWRDASGGLDYGGDVPEPPKPKKAPKKDAADAIDWDYWGKALGHLFQVLAVILAVAGLAYGIFRMMQAPRNRRIAADGVEITVDNVEQYIHETDLEAFLREALEAGNYPLAIRLYYLQIIKQLSQKGSIAWAKEKTNRDYLREMRPQAAYTNFREATRCYERVWYGNQALDKADFERLSPLFRQML